MNVLYIALGYRCSHRCICCPVGDRAKEAPEPSASEIIGVIDEAVRNRQINSVILSGGEPTMHPGFRQILEYCVGRGLSVDLLSNGESLCNVETAQKLLGGLLLGSMHMTTAIHSVEESVHDRVTGVPGSRMRTAQGIKNVMDLGIPVVVKHIISSWNYREMRAFTDYALREFGPGIYLTFCGMDYSGMSEDNVSKAAVSFREIGPYLEQALDRIQELRKEFGAFPRAWVSDLPLCCVDPYYWGSFDSASRGMIAQNSLPGLTEQGLRSEIRPETDCDIFFEECTKCIVSEVCPGAWRTAYSYFGEDAVKSVKPFIGSHIEQE